MYSDGGEELAFTDGRVNAIGVADEERVVDPSVEAIVEAIVDPSVDPAVFDASAAKLLLELFLVVLMLLHIDFFTHLLVLSRTYPA